MRMKEETTQTNDTQNNSMSLGQAMMPKDVIPDPDAIVKEISYNSDVKMDAKEMEQLKAATAREMSQTEVDIVASEEVSENADQDNKELTKNVQAKLTKIDQNMLELTSVEKAGKKASKKIYAEETIISIGDELEVETESERKRQAFIDLSASKKARKPITAVIDGTEIVGDTPCAVVFYENFKVLIPYKEMCISEPEEIRGSAKSKETYKKMLLDMRIGSEIDFIVNGVDEKGEVATASRKAALDVMRRTYYLQKNKSTGQYHINEGNRVEARVTHVLSWGIGVEVFGIESFVRASELAYTRIPNVLDMYQAGDKIILRITKLVRELVTDEEGNKRVKLALTVSAKKGNDDPRDSYFDKFNIGTKYNGIVTQVTADGIFVRLGGEKGKIDCMCSFPKRGGTPTKGSSAIVHISEKVEDTKYIYGTIVRWTPVKR